ncbi:(2Fe-2S)-binding protein [Psychrobacillus sp. NPDC093180]|uniref:(2Fe-2S)-binding protein n=1 Tax=Psychrobacillus sp. NPDC093180 TaxID=3364489 RepID=UPI00380B25AB
MLKRIKIDTTKPRVSFTFNHQKLEGLEGEPVVVALLANGIRSVRRCTTTGEPRGLYCGIGHCYECRATVDGVNNVRSCLTPLKANMYIQTNLEWTEGEILR